jgi:hypothetical protein
MAPGREMTRQQLSNKYPAALRQHQIKKGLRVIVINGVTKVPLIEGIVQNVGEHSLTVRTDGASDVSLTDTFENFGIEGRGVLMDENPYVTLESSWIRRILYPPKEPTDI